MIAVHDVQNIHQLPLVGVDALDLDVEHGIRVQLHAVVPLNVSRKALAAQMLDLHELLEEVLILNMIMQAVHLLRVPMPFMTAENIINQRSKFRICAHQPAAMRDAVGLIVKFARRIIVEILECRGL